MFTPIDQGEDFEHGYSFGCFGCRVVNVFVVSEFRVDGGMLMHIWCSVVNLQVKSSVIFCRISEERTSRFVWVGYEFI